MSLTVNAGQANKTPISSEDSEYFIGLPNEMLEAIFGFLSTGHLPKVALVSRRFNTTVQSTILKQAQEAGYKGDNLSDAKKYLKSFCSLAAEGAILNQYKVSDEQNQVDCVATFKRVKYIDSSDKSTEEEKTNLIEKLNTSLISICENSSNLDNEAMLVMALLACGADLDLKIQSVDGESIIHFAAREGYKRIVALLLEMGANIEAQATKGETPLHFAAAKGQNDIAALLLEKGANVNAPNQFGMTPLHFAAAKGQNDIAALLLEKGANIEARDNKGRTPLYPAALGCQNDIVALLLEKGANIETQDNEGNTPLHFIKRLIGPL